MNNLALILFYFAVDIANHYSCILMFLPKVIQKPKLSPAVKINPLPFAFVVPKSEIMKRYSKEQYRAINDLAKVKLVSSDIKSLLTGLEVRRNTATIIFLLT